MHYDKLAIYERYRKMFGEPPPVQMMENPESDMKSAVDSGKPFKHPEDTAENARTGLMIG